MKPHEKMILEETQKELRKKKSRSSSTPEENARSLHLHEAPPQEMVFHFEADYANADTFMTNENVKKSRSPRESYENSYLPSKSKYTNQHQDSSQSGTSDNGNYANVDRSHEHLSTNDHESVSAIRIGPITQMQLAPTELTQFDPGQVKGYDADHDNDIYDDYERIDDPDQIELEDKAPTDITKGFPPIPDYVNEIQEKSVEGISEDEDELYEYIPEDKKAEVKPEEHLKVDYFHVHCF